MVMTYDEYLKKNKKKKKEEPKVVLGYSNKQNVNNSPKSTTNTQTLIDKYVAEQKAKKDIAPVRTTVTTPKKPGERTWFQAGAFSDGYDFGDVTKTILGTTADVGVGALKGIFHLSEGVVDLGRYGVSGVANVLGAKEYAKDVKKTAQENTTEKWFSPIEKKIDKNSLIGEKGDAIPEGLGYIGGMIATGGVGGAIGGAVSGGAKAVQIGATLGTTGVTFTSAMGSGMSEAYEGGASDEEAVTYGAISGIAEAGTELIFGGLGKSINAVGLNTGLSSADDMLAKKVSEIFKKQVSKNIAETGIKMGAEGTEEVIAGILQAVGQKVTYKSEEELMQLINDQELLESFISGAVVSGIAQAPSVVKDTKAGRDYVTGYTQQEQQAIDKVVNERITEQERQGITLTNKEKNAIIEQTTKEFNEFKEKVKEIAPVKDDVRSQDIAPVGDNVVQQAGQQDTPVNERQQNYVSEAKETDSVYRKNLNEDASKYANNSKRTHEFVNTLSNISEATGENIRLTNNTSEEMVARRNQLIEKYAEKKGISVEEATTKLKDTVIDAYNTGDGITINVNSPKALNRLVGHEITHSLEKTNEYSKLEKIAIDYAKTKGEYDSRVEILESLYDGTNANIQNELTSDIVGDYLFTDQEFINNIQKKDRNLFQRIYDEIKHLIKLVTANTKEAKQLEQLKHSFEKAMEEHKSDKTNKVTVQETKSNSSVEVESNTQEKENSAEILQTTAENGKTSKVSENVEAETKTEDNAEEYSLSQDNKGRELSEEQIEFFKDSKVRDEDGNLLTVYHGTKSEFYTFNNNLSGDNYEGWSYSGKGFYFTDDIKEAQEFGDYSLGDNETQIKEVYLNITNPFDTSTDDASVLEKLSEGYDVDKQALIRGDFLLKWFRSNKINASEVLQKYGYDGVIDYGHYLAYDSNQIKEVTNKKPTLDDDIRYSLTRASDEQVKQAYELEEQNKTPEEIYLETGAYRGADGKWRTEIDDSRAYIKISSTMVGGKYKLNEILSFPKLYKAYPEFKNMTVVFDNNMLPGNLGSYNPNTNILTINSSIYDYDQAELLSAKKQLADWDNTVKTYEVLFSGEQIEQQLETLKDRAKQYKRKDYQKELKSTLLHELQHVIQETEGFASGANVRYWSDKQYLAEKWKDSYIERERALLKKMGYSDFINTEIMPNLKDMDYEEYKQKQEDFFNNSEYAQEYKDLQEMREKNNKRYEILTGRSAYELYRDTAGEEEARDVENRMDWSSKDRKRFMPYTGGPDTVFYEGSYNEEKYGVFLNQKEDVKYSLSVSEANTTKDNEDRELTKGQKEYFKDSKAVDENGNLITVYHTMTNEEPQFNEFNPVGTPYYRFGDQVVNYYTDSKDMSGSYADQDYEMADTKKLNNLEEAKQWLEENVAPYLTVNKVEIVELGNGKYGVKYTSLEDSDVARIVHYDSLDDLLRNIKSEEGRNPRYAKFQYEGYVNLTNPYVVDAGGRGWKYVELELSEYGQKLNTILDELKENELDYKVRRMFDRVMYESDVASDLFNMYQKEATDMQYHILGAYARTGSTEELKEAPFFYSDATIQAELNSTIDGRTLEEIGLEYYNNKYDKLREREFTELKKENPILEKYNIEDLEFLSEVQMEKAQLEYKYKKGISTNDIVHRVIEMNKNGSNYDGVIIKNTIDYGGHSETDNIPNDLYVTFNSNQFKAWDNEKPTDDADIRYSLSVDDYGMSHRPSTDYGDASNFEENMPDVFEHPEWYFFGSDARSKKAYRESLEALRKVRNNPEGEITIYRATIGDSINEGDWITPSKTYAEWHNDSQFDGKANIIELKVKAKDIRFAGDDLNEFGYFPNGTDNFSLSRTTDDIAPVKDTDVFGSDIALQEAIAPLQEQVKELTKAITDLQENIAPASMDLVNEEGHRRLQEMTDEDAPVDEGLFTFLDNEVQVKKKQEIVNEIASDFSIKKTEARELYNKIYSIPEPTIEDIVKELEAYREIKFQEEDDYVKSIQDYIRGTRLDISEIKKQIPDYGNKYRMSNMGKGLILGNSGLKIDSFYQELSELYPNEFPATVTAEADQLELISDAMYREKEFTYTDRIDDDELQILAERIYSDIGNHERYVYAQRGLYFLNQRLDEIVPPGEVDNDMPYASNTKQTGDIAPVSRKLKQLNPEATVSETPVTEGTKITKSKWRNAVDTTQRLFVNEMVETDNLAKETGNLNIKYTGDMLNSVAGEIEGEIQIAQTDNEGHAIGKSLSELFAPAKEKGLYDAFNDYLEHYSNIDRHAQGKGSKVPLNVSQILVKEYEKSYPVFKQWGKDVWKYGANVRDNLIDAGIISEEHAEALGTMYPHYVPYMENREMSNYNPDLGEIKPKGVIKRAVGGAEHLLPIEDALTKYTFGYKKAVRQNQFYQEIVKTLGPGVDVGADVRNDAIDFDDTLYKDETGNYLTAYVDGERISTRITDDLYTGLKNDLSKQIKGLEEKYALITEPVQKLSEIRRNLLTSWNPMFIIRNPIMDVQDALFNSKYTKDFMKNYPKAFVELGKANTETARQFLTLYGSGNVMGEHSSDGSVKNSKFLKNIQKANNIMELAPRYAEFKASLENGASIQEAMYNAREVTTNFSRGGTITKALNKNGFTFLNVSVQGFDKFIRNFSGENGAKGVAGALLKASLLGVVPALFNELAFGGDDEDEEYEALPDYIKDNYYLIKSGEGEFIRIPKGRMLSVFGSAGRRTLEFMQGEEDAFEGFLKNAYSQVGISNPLDSNILTPLIQAYSTENGEAWYGGDLVPSRLQKKAPEEQYDASTDKMSIWLGDKLGISPYKLNYVLDQYSGGIGDIFLPFITEESTSDAEGLGMVLAPIKDQFTANSTSDNKYASEIYTLSDKMDKMPEATKETDEYKVQDAYLYSVTSEMGKLYAERREVQADKDLSKSEKYKKVQAIQKQINDLAKEGMENYQNISKTDNYAIVGGREFNKYTTDDGTERWGSVFEDVLEDLNSLGMDLDEKSEYFKATSTISSVQDSYKGSDDFTGKKQEVIGVIKGTNLTGEQKAYLYDKYYGNSDVVEAMVNLNVDIDSFLDYEAQDFTADKYANGKTVPNSKKRKVFEYINSMPIEFEQRLILAKLQYPSYNEYNPTIIEYLNNSEMTYEQVETLLTKMDFKVDEYGNIRW